MRKPTAPESNRLVETDSHRQGAAMLSVDHAPRSALSVCAGHR